MERATSAALDSLAGHEHDVALVGVVRAHRRHSARHRKRVIARLRALGAAPAPRPNAVTSVLGGSPGTATGGGATKEEQLRQAVLLKQLEVATYDTVERLARRAGDDASVRVGRQARMDAEALARRLLRIRLRLQLALRGQASAARS
jgi:ferritin-like metal-binding protein YciE